MSGANEQPASLAAGGRESRRGRWLLVLAFLLWSGAVALALWAQYLITPLGRLQQAVYTFAGAAAVGLVACLLIDRFAPRQEEPPAPHDLEPWRWRSLRNAFAVLLLVGSLAATASSVHALVRTGAYRDAVLYWIFGLVLAAAAMIAGARRPLRLAAGAPRRRRAELLAVLAVLAVAIALRLPDLERIPVEVHGDEAACGLEGRSILRGEVPNLFSVGWYHIPYLSFAISAASMRVFGDDLWGFRMASVIQGTLSVLLLYVLAKRLFSMRVGFIAAALLALSHWHIHFSRSGINYMQALFATLLVLVFVVRGIQERRALDWLLAGFAVGLCLNVYYAARLAPVLAGLYLMHRIVFERPFLRTHWPGIAAMVLGAALFFAPMGVVFARAPRAFMTRTEGVFVLTTNNLKHAYYTYQVDSVAEVLREQIERTVTAFNWRGETSLQHNHKAALIDFWSSALFVVGVAAYGWRLRRPSFFLLGTWFWLAITLGSVLTVDALFSPRVIVSIPAIVVFPALVVDAGWRAFARLLGRFGNFVFAAPAAAFLVLAARANYDDYFELHIGRMQSAGINTTLARYVEQVNDRYQIWLLGQISLRYDTEHFLIPNVDGVETGEIDPTLPLARIPAHKGVVFLVPYAETNAQARLERIQKVYPRGQTSVVKTPIGIPVFHAHLVENADLAAANPRAVSDARPVPALRLADLQRRSLTGVPRRAASTAPAPAPPPPPAAPGAEGPWLALPDLAEPLDLAVGSAGEIYVTDRPTRQVQRFDARGGRLGTLTAGGAQPFEDPRAVAVGPNGEVFILDSKPTRVHVFDAAGKFSRTVALPGGYYPNGIAVDDTGAILVADTGQSRAVRVRPDGGVAVIGKSGNQKTYLDQPTDIALGPGGEIFVADGARSRVIVFGPDLAYRREWEIPPSPVFPGQHLLITGARVLVSQPEQGVVLVYDVEGKLQAEWGRERLRQPVGLAVDAAGELLVTDVGARGVFKLPLDGSAGAARAAAR